VSDWKATSTIITIGTNVKAVTSRQTKNSSRVRCSDLLDVPGGDPMDPFARSDPLIPVVPWGRCFTAIDSLVIMDQPPLSKELRDGDESDEREEHQRLGGSQPLVVVLEAGAIDVHDE